MPSLRACRIFHFIKNVHTLRELCFDGYTFPKLVDIYTSDYMIWNFRRREICEDIAVLNQLLNLRKIEVECAVHFDISPIIVKGLCKEKKWIHQYKNCIHTFDNILTTILMLWANFIILEKKMDKLFKFEKLFENVTITPLVRTRWFSILRGSSGGQLL